jgi:hypothetical protein
MTLILTGDRRGRIACYAPSSGRTRALSQIRRRAAANSMAHRGCPGVVHGRGRCNYGPETCYHSPMQDVSAVYRSAHVRVAYASAL